MVPRSTQPLTEMSTKNLPGVKGRPARKVDLTAICEPTVSKKCWSLNVSQLYGPPQLYLFFVIDVGLTHH
jgi:hypothetical protein